MRPSLRTIAVLMLLAGGSLGLFAATLVADDTALQAPTDLDKQVDTQVRYYELEFGLDENQREAVRATLLQQRRATLDLLRQLHQENRERFDAIGDQTVNRIRKIVGPEAFDKALAKPR